MEYDDIVDCKANCDSEQYFWLFDKHIPVLKDGSAVLLYAISNIDCIANIINKNPRSIYYICDTETIFDLLKLTNENTNLVYVESLDVVIEKDMKFDCIIMNPPYSRNLHLKILAEAIKHLKDDESVCVNLSPILWLENPLAEYKLKSDYYRFKDLRMHIKEVNVVDVNSANESFNIGLFCDLGVYVASKKENCEYTNVEILKQCLGKNYFILRKVLNTKTDKVSNHIKKGFNGICVKVATVRGFGSGNNFDIVSLIHSTPYINGKGYAENKFKKKDVIVKDDYSNEEFCHFNDEISATNFIKSTRTKFYHWLVKCIKLDQNIPLQFLPFMDDYTKPWTDDRFYKFFNITQEEQKIIEETMAKYK